jgi:hypothetical protein
MDTQQPVKTQPMKPNPETANRKILRLAREIIQTWAAQGKEFTVDDIARTLFDNTFLVNDKKDRAGMSRSRRLLSIRLWWMAGLAWPTNSAVHQMSEQTDEPEPEAMRNAIAKVRAMLLEAGILTREENIPHGIKIEVIGFDKW